MPSLEVAAQLFQDLVLVAKEITGFSQLRNEERKTEKYYVE